MAIGANAIVEFFGTQDTVTDGSTSAVASTAFSVAGDISAWTNDDDAPRAVAVLMGDFASAPTAGETVGLFVRPLNIDSTSDAPTPVANFKSTRLGQFTVDADASAQYVQTEVDLPNGYTSQQYEFYIQNNTSVSLDAGWTLKVTPKTYGPHA